jgi:SsrA-binding protein
MSAYIQNRKVRFDFEILETIEAGVVLFGYEVKAVRKGLGKLEGAYVVIHNNEAFLVGARISYYQEANTPKDYNPDRQRKLLLSKKELAKLTGTGANTGLTVVPLSWYNKGSKVKLEIALAKGKKKQDKRESLKKRDSKREIDRILKTQ